MSRILRRTTLLIIVGWCGLGVGLAQVATGLPPFGSFGGGPFDTVNLADLDVHLQIPIVNKPGSGLPTPACLATCTAPNVGTGKTATSSRSQRDITLAASLQKIEELTYRRTRTACGYSRTLLVRTGFQPLAARWPYQFGPLDWRTG